NQRRSQCQHFESDTEESVEVHPFASTEDPGVRLCEELRYPRRDHERDEHLRTEVVPENPRRDDTRAADKNRRCRTQTERATDQLSDAFRMLRRLADDVRSVAPVDKDVCEGGEGCQEVPQPEVDRSERSADRTSQHDCQHCRRDLTRAEMEDVP